MSAPGRRHLNGRFLAEYLRGELRASRKAVAENHLALCAKCRTMAQTAAAMLRLGITADELESRATRAAKIVSEVIETEAPHRVRGLIASAEWGADRFVAGRLLERSREEFARDPRTSMRLARAALWVAERGDSAELQFEAWRDCISIAAYLGSFSDAWDAIDRAAALVPRLHDRRHAEGVLLYARAYVASQPDVWKIDEALQWTGEASEIFERTDAERFRSAVEMRAYLHDCREEHAAAVEICRKLWATQPEIGLALSFVAYLVAYGKADEAEEVLSWARSHLNSSETERVARYSWAEARVRALQERWDTAVEAFERAAETFRTIGMEDTAIRVDLGRIRAEVSAAPDSLAAAEKAMRDLRQVVRTSAELDRRDPTRRRRFTVQALDYLRELAEANTLTADLVAHVEDYLDVINRGPARPFVRPVPAQIM